MRRYPLVLACGVVYALAGAAPAARQTDGRLETDVKATFLYQFSRYVEWPASAFSAADAPFKVCVLADAQFVQSLEKTLEGETAHGRLMTRSSPDTPEAARECHILYVGRAELGRHQSLIAAVQDAPVLTVSDAPAFMSLGGDILLVRENHRIRFDINLAAIRKTKITVRSQLLRVARRVITDTGK